MKNGNDDSESNAIVEPDQEQGASYIGAGGEGGDESIVIPESRATVSKGTVVLFGILVLGAVGFYVMYRQTGPKSASASVNKETAAAKKTINTFLSGGDINIKTMESLIKNTEKVVQQFIKYPTKTQVPLSDLRTNPFRLYEKPVTTNANASEEADKKKREEERLAILKKVQNFQLQSIMYSDARRACMINNTLYREGQTVDGFSIEKITQSSVVVKNGPYRFELTMQK
jgi:hypothetical protein